MKRKFLRLFKLRGIEEGLSLPKNTLVPPPMEKAIFIQKTRKFQGNNFLNNTLDSNQELYACPLSKKLTHYAYVHILISTSDFLFLS